MKILVTGATGYIGSRLAPRLLEAGHEVRCLSRDPANLARQPWIARVEVATGDALDPVSLERSAAGCEAAFYLIHAMGGGPGFDERDRAAALNFADAAGKAGLRRVVYLGGLGPETGRLSPHLRSRHEVGRLLATGTTPVTEVRAAVIVGAGSLSFEMLRGLTEVLPVMTTPRWVRTSCQPIAIQDVLHYLVSAIADGEPISRILEIGGPEVLTYEQMIRTYAREVGLHRLIIPVPVLSPALSSLWVGLVTPLPTSVARPLVESLRHEVVTHDATAHHLFPHELMPFREALRLALSNPPTVASASATDPLSPLSQLSPGDPAWSGGTTYLDRQIVPTDAAPEHLFWAFSRIGGDVGYYELNWAWRLRALLDRLVGGVGLRRGRRHPEELKEGDELDFWRVERVVSGGLVRLKAEMRLPGSAWLQWEAVPVDGGSDLIQTAIFRPRGLLGRLYWFAMLPFHAVVFGRTARRIAAIAEERGYSCPC
jgi:uncharacterized protein YbjT (DUF2867 family)